MISSTSTSRSTLRSISASLGERDQCRVGLSATYQSTDDQDIQIKQEPVQYYFAPHVWYNEAPLWQGMDAFKKEQAKGAKRACKVIQRTCKDTRITYFSAAGIPEESRDILRKQINDYKSLDNQSRAIYLDERMKARTSDGAEIPVLKDQKEVAAARAIRQWELLGHYAGITITETKYKKKPSVMGAAKSRIEAYSVALPRNMFLSGYRHGNVTSLINAHTTYEENPFAEKNPSGPSPNVSFLRHVDNDRWLILLIATTAIKEGQTLWLDYGKKYWESLREVIDVSSDGERDSDHSVEVENNNCGNVQALAPVSSGIESPVARRSPETANRGINVIAQNSLADSALVPLQSSVSRDKDCKKTVLPVNSKQLRINKKTESAYSVKKNECPECRKCFKHLKRHMLIHSGEKSHKCQECLKSFSRADHLRRHLLTHGNKKRHKRTKCRKRFSRTDNILTQGCRKSHECQKCKKCFDLSGNVKQHLRLHSGEKPFECRECSKRFMRSGSLADHLRIHTGDKPYKCQKCSKSFGQSSHLKRHLRIHSGEKPFVCPKCHKCFTQSSNLNTHIFIHTRTTSIMASASGQSVYLVSLSAGK